MDLANIQTRHTRRQPARQARLDQTFVEVREPGYAHPFWRCCVRVLRWLNGEEQRAQEPFDLLTIVDALDDGRVCGTVSATTEIYPGVTEYEWRLVVEPIDERC